MIGFTSRIIKLPINSKTSSFVVRKKLFDDMRKQGNYVPTRISGQKIIKRNKKYKYIKVNFYVKQRQIWRTSI